METNYMQRICPYCGCIHAGMCTRVKAVEYFEDGRIKRIEFFDGYNVAEYNYLFGKSESKAIIAVSG